MRRFKFDKLVRDKIVDSVIANGNNPHWKELDDDEYIKELQAKLLEETSEISDASRDELPEEIADVQEIIDNLLDVLGITKDQLAAIQEKKNEQKGSFKKRQYIDFVEVKDDAREIEYYLKYPEKYPEIK